jgi:PIN domain nuclease of toxin-antitoxin system
LRALLDTHAFLWWITDDSRLSERAREFISAGENELLFSAASGWEVAIKAGLGKIELPEDLERFLTEQLHRNAVGVLPVNLGHAIGVYSLPDHHRDPFDRLLVAQCVSERLPLLSRDTSFQRYPVEVIW